MRVFCPNCGNENQGEPGAKVTCVACTASFDVPGGSGGPAPFPAAAPQPPAPPFAEPAPQPPLSQPFASAPPPPPSPGTTNTLAVISFVTGLLCCLPVVAQAVGLVCGFMALSAIDESRGAQGGRGLAIAGLILSGLSLVGWVLGVLVSALN